MGREATIYRMVMKEHICPFGLHGFGADLEWSAVELSRMHFINLSVVCSLEPFGRSEWIQLWRSASF